MTGQPTSAQSPVSSPASVAVAPEPVHVDDLVTVYNADCLDVLRSMPDCSVDAVVTDPPYGLGFMGKEWDRIGDTGRGSRVRVERAVEMTPTGQGHSTSAGPYLASGIDSLRSAGRPYQAWCEVWARECLRVLKPGGHMLAFGGTRTAHRLACAIEDAGFELRDAIAWLYGSGFPKSLDVSKALDKRAGHWRGRAGEVDTPNAAMTGANYERTDKGEPVTAAAAAAAGWGTALKPANEPIIVARKSPAGSVADNWLAYGTGALNIDACRTATDDVLHTSTVPNDMRGGHYGSGHRTGEPSGQRRYAEQGGTDFAATPGPRGGDDRGRWPTNVVLDPDAAAALDAQTGTLTSGANPTRRGSDKFRDAYGDFRGQESCDPARGADSGGASRFFPVFSPYWRGETCCMCNGTGRDASYVTEPTGHGLERVVGRVENGRACRACNGHGRDPSDMPTFRYEAKAPTDERPRVGEVAHPTVKPLDLMRWLVRLVTPPGGVVLDPFAGSGTTAEACIVEGFRCIAIEREADYLPLILSRITKPIEPVLFGGVA